jgi:hypothetical protein
MTFGMGDRVRYVSGVRESLFGREGEVVDTYEDVHVIVYTVKFDDGDIVAAYPHNFLPVEASE